MKITDDGTSVLLTFASDNDGVFSIERERIILLFSGQEDRKLSSLLDSASESFIEGLPRVHLEADITTFSKILSDLVYQNVPEAILSTIYHTAKTLDVEVISQHKDFHAVPWELLRLPFIDEYLSIVAKSFTRSISGFPINRHLQKLDRLRILYVLARSRDEPDVDPHQISLPILKLLEDQSSNTVVDIVRPPTLEQIEILLQKQNQYQIIHFDTHGAFRKDSSQDCASESPHIILSHRYGGKKFVSIESISKLVSRFGASILAFNGCQTARLSQKNEIQPQFQESASKHFSGTTIAMRNNVSTTFATDYFREFYSAIASGMSDIDAASSARRAACKRVPNSNHSFYAAMPIIYSSSSNHFEITTQQKSPPPITSFDRNKKLINALSEVTQDKIINEIESAIVDWRPYLITIPRCLSSELIEVYIRWWLTNTAADIKFIFHRPTDDWLKAVDLTADEKKAVNDILAHAFQPQLDRSGNSTVAEKKGKLSPPRLVNVIDLRDIPSQMHGALADAQSFLKYYHALLAGFVQEFSSTSGSIIILINHEFFSDRSSLSRVVHLKKNNTSLNLDILRAELQQPKIFDIVKGLQYAEVDGFYAISDAQGGALDTIKKLSFCFGTTQFSSPSIGYYMTESGLASELVGISQEEWHDIFVCADLIGLSKRHNPWGSVIASGLSGLVEDLGFPTNVNKNIKEARRIALTNFAVHLSHTIDKGATERRYALEAADQLKEELLQILSSALDGNEIEVIKHLSKAMFQLELVYPDADISRALENHARDIFDDYIVGDPLTHSVDFAFSQLLTTAIFEMRKHRTDSAKSMLRMLVDKLDNARTPDDLKTFFLPAVLHELGSAFFDEKDFEQAIPWLERSLEMEDKIGDGRNIAKSHYQLAYVKSQMGKAIDARQHLEKAIVKLERLGDDTGLRECRGALSLVVKSIGDNELHLENAQARVVLSRRFDDSGHQIDTLIDLSLAYASSNQRDEARRILLQCQKRIELQEKEYVGSTNYYNLSMAFSVLEDYEISYSLLSKIVDRTRVDGSKREYLMACHELATAAKNLSKTDEAIRLWRAVIYTEGDQGGAEFSIIARVCIVNLMIEEGNNSEAIDEYLNAVKAIKSDEHMFIDARTILKQAFSSFREIGLGEQLASKLEELPDFDEYIQYITS